MNPIAGGSGLNTATHLSALVRYFELESDNTMDINLQTCINDSDEFGRLIVNHAKEYNFQLSNCRKRSEGESEEDILSTGHCVVFVENGERRFATHLGIIETFKAADTILHELVGCRSADPKFLNHHHHIHIAGYYNIPGFAENGNLKRRLKLIREKRRAQSTGNVVFTTTISLVPQYDATEEWNGGLLTDVLPLVDFFILNTLEASKLSGIHINDKDLGNDLERRVTLLKLADFFWEKSPQTYVIITLGKFGAVCLFTGEVLATVNAPLRIDQPLDPTGAGDSFTAGFIYGAMDWRRAQDHEKCSEIGSNVDGTWLGAIVEGMWCGCATGCACVQILGASVPSSKEALEALLYPLESDTNRSDSSREQSQSYDSDSYNSNDEYLSTSYESNDDDSYASHSSKED